MVTVIKPLDPRDLNEAIKCKHFPLPTIEEVTARMPNAKVFFSPRRQKWVLANIFG